MQINCESMIVTPNEDGTYKLELLNCQFKDNNGEEIMGRVSEVTDSVLDEIIEYLKNTNIAGEFDCAIKNYHEVFKKHNVDTFCDYIADIDSYTPVGSMQSVVDGANIKTDVDSFIHDYYEEVIKCVCNVIESFKSADGEEDNESEC